ncbi:MAG: cysteine hydrolase family protein [Spirochaetales bacterium]|nr:cysteine hydrolase family protein [Spirochaetales bacterium]
MKKALVVVDYQHDFIDGSLGFPGAEKLDCLIAAKVRQAIADGTQVFFTLDTHGEDYLSTNEGRHLPVVHCVRESHGWELYGQTAQAAGEALKKGAVLIEKGQFGSPDLAREIQCGGFAEVEICGLVSDICVVSNALMIKAFAPEARVVVDSRATSCADSAKNAAALQIMRSCQIEVL